MPFTAEQQELLNMLNRFPEEVRSRLFEASLNLRNPYRSLAQLTQEVSSRHIQLPDFQRDFVWDKSTQAGMVASFLLGVPLGSLLVFEGPYGQYASKTIGTINDQRHDAPAEKVMYLLDGQQRLTTLNSVFYDWFLGKTDAEIEVMLRSGAHRQNKSLYKALQLRWFIDLKADMEMVVNESEGRHLDLFGSKNLKLDATRFFECPDAERLQNAGVIVAESINNGNQERPFHPTTYLNNPQPLIEYCVTHMRLPLFMLATPDHHHIFDTIIARIEEKRLEELNKTESDWAAELTDYLREGRVNDTSYFLLEIIPEERIKRGFFSFAQRNSTGMELKAFDLLAARGASALHKLTPNEDGILRPAVSCNLAELIILELNNACSQDLNELQRLRLMKNKEISSKFRLYFPQVISALSAYHRGATTIEPELTKTAGIINNTQPQDVVDHYKCVALALLNAAQFAQAELGVGHLSGFAFSPVFLPIAYVFAVLGTLTPDQKSLVKAWYWVTLFSLEYGRDASTSAAKDCAELLTLLRGSQLSVRFNSRLQDVDGFELFNQTRGMVQGLNMSGNNLENTTSQRKIIANFLFCEERARRPEMFSEGEGYEYKPLLPKRSGQNIFDHPFNSTCQVSHFDQDHLNQLTNNQDITQIRSLYLTRSQALIQRVRDQLSVLRARQST